MSFPVQYSFPIAWGDMDAFAHVNNVNYLRYFESARAYYFDQMSINWNENNSDIKPILANISCQYKRPLTYPDHITCHIRVKDLGYSSITMECEIHSPKAGLAAIAEAVVVMFDFKNQRPTRVPEEVRAAIQKMENIVFEK